MARKYKATLFMNGGSQAVRLPKECRFEGNAVHVWREGSRVIMEPIERRGWSPGFWERMDAMASGVDIEVPEPLPSSEYRYAIFEEDDNTP